MIVLSINLLILSVCILIAGLINPNWILFWMEKPGRMPVVILSSALFMIAVVMFGESNLQNQNEKAKQSQQTEKSKESADIPVPIATDSK